MLEARKHLVQYLHALPGAKSYRRALVSVESPEDVDRVLMTIRTDHSDTLDMPIPGRDTDSVLRAWEGYTA